MTFVKKESPGYLVPGRVEDQDHWSTPERPGRSDANGKHKGLSGGRAGGRGNRRPDCAQCRSGGGLTVAVHELVAAVRDASAHQKRTAEELDAIREEMRIHREVNRR